MLTFVAKIYDIQELPVEFEDTKGAIRIRNSKDRQHNDHNKKDKRTNNDLQNINLKIEQHEPHNKPRVNSVVAEPITK
jgi:hypothetical protein